MTQPVCRIGKPTRALACVLGLSLALPALCSGFDRSAAWPLCGRISEHPPAGWEAADGCPAARFGDPGFSDEPLSSTFGPRPLYSENNRYDFHRGLDIATPTGTPFFAVSAGEVRIAGPNPSYSDPLVQLRHVRPEQTECIPGGCYYSLYLHVDAWVVEAGEQVEKGQLLGYTGASGSGFEHLHFEVRSAPPSDPFSAWSRDAVHPLRLLPYAASPEAEVTFHSSGELTLVSSRYDLVAVDIEVLDGKHRPVAQAGDLADSRGYYVRPPFFDMERANFDYSHKDSQAYPWDSFGAGGVNECPFYAEHGGSYSPHVHLDAQDPADYRRGLFNGIGVRTLRYWPSDEGDYEIGLEFQQLTGNSACLELTATFTDGASAYAQQGDCIATEAQRLPLRLTATGRKVRLTWKPETPRKVRVYRNGIPLEAPVTGNFFIDRDVSAGGRYRYRVCPLGAHDRCSRSRVIHLDH
jgi:murein DD-endopeptidase MepM/ murein hydrolase activator NlpD